MYYEMHAVVVFPTFDNMTLTLKYITSPYFGNDKLKEETLVTLPEKCSLNQNIEFIAEISQRTKKKKKKDE